MKCSQYMTKTRMKEMQYIISVPEDRELVHDNLVPGRQLVHDGHDQEGSQNMTNNQMTESQ